MLSYHLRYSPFSSELICLTIHPNNLAYKAFARASRPSLALAIFFKLIIFSPANQVSWVTALPRSYLGHL